MAITLETTCRDAACNAVVDRIDSGGGAGFLEFQHTAQNDTYNTVEVATITFDATSFGAASTGVATMASAPKSDTNATGSANPIVAFTVFDNANAPLFSGAVSTIAAGTGDIQLSSVVVAATDTVELTTMTVTMPAS